MKLSVGVKTDVGHVREGNEDSYLADAPLFAVADGMGGHVAGDVASTTAIEVLLRHQSDDLAGDPAQLKEILREANQAILQKAEQDPALRGMGTTCTMLVFDDGTAHIAHVGDSRAYLFRDGELTQKTQDHTLVERMVREGRLTNEEAAHHPHRNIITNALGMDSDVNVDLFSIQLREGDRFIICSDGLSSMIDDGTFSGILAADPNPQSTAEKLVTAALDAGGEDNVTVIVLDAAEGDGAEQPAVAPPPPAVERVDTEPEVRTQRRLTPLARRLLIAGIGVLVLAGAVYAALRVTLANSWFVGVNEEGFVTIYNGIPEEIAGLELKEVEEETGIAVSDLPDFIRADVKDGQKVDSLDEARETVANLKARMRDDQQETDQTNDQNNKDTNKT